MNISDAGIEALQKREGSSLTAYRDSAGLLTIGTGHLLGKDELSSGKVLGIDWKDGITPELAADLLKRDLAAAQAVVNVAITVPLVQYQFDALVSFAFNVGSMAFRQSTLARILNAGDYVGVPAQLARWIHSAGAVDPGLVTRRKSEIEQWENA
ncbi:MAG TPA: lysozyme [Candidatus Bathyarchaeia archaeon]